MKIKDGSGSGNALFSWDFCGEAFETGQMWMNVDLELSKKRRERGFRLTHRMLIEANAPVVRDLVSSADVDGFFKHSAVFSG